MAKSNSFRCNKKGDISINMVFIVVITIASIVLLLGLFSTRLPSFAKSIYCNTFFYIHSSTFVPREMRADQDYCNKKESLAPTVQLTSEDDANITILAHMISCWKQMDEGKSTKNRFCHELTIGPDFTIPIYLTEKEITTILYNNSMCKYLPNSDIDISIPPQPSLYCGDNSNPAENKIDWRLGDYVYPKQNILVEYSAVDKVIIVS